MQITEMVVPVHKRERAKSGQAPRRVGLRKWISRLNIRAAARLVCLTVAGVLLCYISAHV